MKTLLLSVVCLFSVAAALELTVVTFNVEWLFHVDPSRPSCNPTWLCDPADAFDHMNKTAEQIRISGGDIVFIQEVEDDAILRELNDILYYQHGIHYHQWLVPGYDTATGQNVAVFSKFPLASGTDVGRSDERVTSPYQGSECRFNGDSRSYQVTKHMHATLRIDNRNVVVATAHFKASAGSSNCVYREAQSKVMGDLIHRLSNNGNLPVILGGDFNTYDLRIPEPVPRDVVSSLEIDVMREYGRNSVSVDKMENTNLRWYELNDNKPMMPDSPFTNVIDHILVSEHFEIEDAFAETTYPNDRDNYSDHLPIIAKLCWNGEGCRRRSA